MRKLLSAFLALSLLAGCGGYEPPQETSDGQDVTEETIEESEEAEETAYEETSDEPVLPEGTEWTLDFPASGFIFCGTDEIADDSLGEFQEANDKGELEYGQGLILATCEYLFRTREEREAIYSWLESDQGQSGDEGEARMEEYLRPKIPMISVFAVNGGRGFDYIQEKLISDPDMIDAVVDLGEHNGFQYYFGKINPDADSIRKKLEGVDQAQIDDYKAKADAIAAHPEWFVFTQITPDFVPIQIGTKASFTAKDLEGNEISSDALFSNSEITVVNVWRTWCSVCISEFEDLQEIMDSYGGRVGLVTYCNDAVDAERINTAASIVSDYHFTANLAQSEELDEIFKCQGTPYTYFLDRNGNSLCYPISGSDLSRIREYIGKLLNGEKIQDVIERPSSDEQGNYIVLVTDQNDDPVTDAMISFCSDTACDVVRTDSRGEAHFTGPKQNYHVHIVSVPSGYSYEDDGSISLDDESNSVWIVIGKD